MLRKADGSRKEAAKGKMATNWEGPYKIVESLRNRAYQLRKFAPNVELFLS